MSVFLDDPYTIRILELDGGGMRGCYSLWGLNKIGSNHGLPLNNLNSFFDVMCGTSIGGLATLGMCFGKSPLDIFSLMEDKGREIFNASWTWGYGRATWADKAAFITGISESLYGNTVLSSVVDNVVGTKSLDDIQGTKVLIPTVKYDPVVQTGDLFPKKGEVVLLSNTSGPGFTTSWRAKDAAMATSAAPMYLPKWSVGGKTYLDGGLAQNNMSPMAIQLGRILKPQATRVFVLSMGTGLGNMGFERQGSGLHAQRGVGVSNINLLADCLSMAIAFPQESNDFLIDLMTRVSTLSVVKYRFNADFDPSKDTELDASSSEAIAEFKRMADVTYQRDLREIDAFCQNMRMIP